MTIPKFAYEEPKQALSSRISAHSKYSDFNLHEWIKKHFKIQSKDHILDLGCGDGNFTALFREMAGKEGVIWGLDKSPQLIREAETRYSSILSDKVKFWVHDFDRPFSHEIKNFQWVFAIYALYYTEDSQKILATIYDYLSAKGRFVVIGPGPHNAQDLSEFNFQLTGKKPHREYGERIVRISKEFRPLFEKIFGKENVEYEEIDSVMAFPTAESYGEYYWSTLLWRESIEGCSPDEVKKLQQETIIRVSKSLPAHINKQMCCLVGRKG